jgi:hypothetical protein
VDESQARCSTIAAFNRQPAGHSDDRTQARPARPRRTLGLLEPLCEHFDQGTLSLNELRAQLAAQQLDSTPQDITSLLDVWIRLDILVPWPKPEPFRAQRADPRLPRLPAPEHRLGLCLEIEAYLRHLERLAGYIQDAFDIRDGNDLARQLRLLDMRVRDVLKKLANDEQALVAVAERAKTSDRQIRCASVTPKSWRPGTNTSSR